MIELTRYFLAVAVAQAHLWPKGQDWMSQIAVFAFYTLSGYLMTRVLNERYGFSWSGTGAFMLNRALRLGPAYYAILAATLMALTVLPLQDFHPLIRMPSTAADIVTNALVFGQVTFDYAQWAPLAKPLITSWSLSIEMCCYLLLAIYFARSPRRLIAFAAIGVVLCAVATAQAVGTGDEKAYGPYFLQNRYGVVQAGFLPFAAGGVFYFYREAITGWIAPRAKLLCSLFAVAWLAMFAGRWISATAGPYLGIPFTYLLLTLAPGARPSRLQDFFGRASYHLFIAHMPVAAMLVVGLHLPASKFVTFVASIAIAFGVSFLLVPLERRIELIRRRVSGRDRETPPAMSRD
ncbi:MAG: acyltransferase [Proteobacteria bacterium]|nr:acyltransferase [Pseudomonadota bacterium]